MPMLQRSVVVVAALVMATGPLVAQQGGPGRGMGRMMAAPGLEMLASRLNLTAEQQAKIKVMIAKFETDTKGARATMTKNREAVQGGADPASFREENMAAMMVVRDAMTELNGNIRGALTPEQQAEFEKWQEEQRASMRQGRPGGPPPAR